MGSLARHCGPSLGGGARGRPWTCTLRSVSGIVPRPHVHRAPGGAVWSGRHTFEGALGGTGRVGGSVGGSAGCPAWDILVPFLLPVQAHRLLEQSLSHSAAEVTALEVPAQLSGVLLSLVCLLCLLGPPSVLLKPSGSSCLLRFPWGALNGTSEQQPVG